MLRVVHPALCFRFAQMHDAGIRECFQALLRVSVTQHMWEMASLPFASGGLCWRNAERLLSTAHWASWADALPVIRARHPDVADHMLVSLWRWWVPLGGRDRLVAAGVGAPEWGDVDPGQRPGSRPDDEFPTISSTGWQSFASSTMEDTFFRSTVWPRLGP